MSKKRKVYSVMDDLYEWKDEKGDVRFSYIKKKGKHKVAKTSQKSR